MENAFIHSIYNFFKVKISNSITCEGATLANCLTCKSDRTYNSVTHACGTGPNKKKLILYFLSETCDGSLNSNGLTCNNSNVSVIYQTSKLVEYKPHFF